MWIDRLEYGVYERLVNCKSKKSDIEPLVNAKWASMKEAGKDKEGFTKEDALASVLELLDSNSQDFDLTEDEYNELIREIPEKISDEPERRYYAESVNGKGYIYDREFNVNVPISVESTYDEAVALVEKFNKEDF